MVVALLVLAMLILLGGVVYGLVALSRQMLATPPDFEGSIPVTEFTLVEDELSPPVREEASSPEQKP